MAPEKPRLASVPEIAKAVLSGFFGVRRRADHDTIRFNPVHLVAAGVVAASAFVVSLVLLVKFIVSTAG
jgi:hypothetical protein